MKFSRCLFLLLLLFFQSCGKPYDGTKLIKEFKRTLTDNGWFIGTNGKQYHLSSAENGFYESGDACQKIDGNLVTISNEKDQESLNAFITESKPKRGQYYWIGLYGGGGASPWIWQASNTPASNFINWSPGQPGSGNDCGAAGADGSWFTKGCDEKLFGICEKLGPLIQPISTAVQQQQQQQQPQTSNGSAATTPAKGDSTGDATPPKGALNDASEGSPAQTTAVQENKQEKPANVEKKFTKGERCNLVNFINHIGRPIKISRDVNKGQTKDYVIEGENYKINTVFRKVENPLKMGPVVYSARQTDNGKRLALDGKESFSLMPGDCDGEFIDIIVSPLPEKEDLPAIQRSAEANHEKSSNEKSILDSKTPRDEDIKSKPLCQVESFGGTSDGGCCHFPFKYKGKLYFDCTTSPKRHLWCGTTRDFDSDRRWGYCCREGECVN